jgi:hypothetical protein
MIIQLTQSISEKNIPSLNVILQKLLLCLIKISPANYNKVKEGLKRILESKNEETKKEKRIR